MTQGKQLRQLLATQKPIMAPGAADGLSARLIQAAGFPAIYAGGGAIARVAGYPDIGMLQLAEVLDRVEKIVDVTSLPVIVDADTGFGGLANLQRTARSLSRIGVAAFHIEDQVFPKRCGLMAGKELISSGEMVQKIKIAKDAIAGDTLLIARCDALTVEGFASTLERIALYMQAGADMLFVEGLSSIEQLMQVNQSVDCLKMLDLYPGPESPLPKKLLMHPDQLVEMGFHLLVYPSDMQRAAISTMNRVLQHLKTAGHTQAMANEFVSFSERDALVATNDYLNLGNSS